MYYSPSVYCFAHDNALSLLHVLFEPAREILVLNAQATSEGSGKPAHPGSLARAFAVCTHELWKQTKGQTQNQTSSPTGWLHMRI